MFQAWQGGPGKHLLRLLSPAGGEARLTIAAFHRVHKVLDPLFPDEPTAASFDVICGHLGRWFNVLPLQEAVSRLKAGQLPERALAITFDDGYADNHEVALPILRRHGLFATVFVASGFVDGGRMWNDTVIEAIRRTTQDTVDLGALKLDGVGKVSVQDVADKRSAIGHLLPALKYLPQTVRDEAAQRVVDACQVDDLPCNLMLSSAQLRSMSGTDMTIGSHTRTHPILMRLSDNEALAEMTAGRDDLQQVIGQPVSLFAFPNGRPNQDYGRVHVAMATDLGFSAAMSSAFGAANAHSALHELPRFTPWGEPGWRWLAQFARNYRHTPRCAE